MHNLKDLEKIVCPRCKFVIQKRIGMVALGGFLWHFHRKHKPQKKADFYFDLKDPNPKILSSTISFYCPQCCTELHDTAKIRAVLKRYLIMQKLEGHKKH